MSSTACRALATLLIALHAAIAACGPGLHAAPGLAHAGMPGSAARADDGAEIAPPSLRLIEHCPLCDYFAQGQLIAGRASCESRPLAAAAEPARPLLLAPRPARSPSRSRAPPSGGRQDVLADAAGLRFAPL